MMRVFKYLFLFFICFLFSAATLDTAAAQSYRGAYPGSATDNKKKDEDASIPKIFSSQVASVQQAEKVDLLYAKLLLSLINYATTDFSYQTKMYDLVSAERFQYTRYSKEFSGTLKDGMSSLNKNYNAILADIQNAKAEYLIIRDGIRPVDYETLDPLWERKIAEFKEVADAHFKLQGRFLNTYKSLIDFILKQGGSYYYKSDDQRVYFYKFGGYKFFGKSLDQLRRVSYEQKKNLKENASATFELEEIQ